MTSQLERRAGTAELLTAIDPQGEAGESNAAELWVYAAADRRRPGPFHQHGERAGPGQKAQRLVKVADREVSRLPPAQDQLGREQQVGHRNQQANQACSGLAGDGPEGQRHGEKQQDEARKAQACDQFKRRVQHTIPRRHGDSASADQRLACFSNRPPAPRNSTTGSQAATIGGRVPFTPNELKLKPIT